jgi:hypothetical protein
MLEDELRFNPIKTLVPKKVMVFYDDYVEVGTIRNGKVMTMKPATKRSLSFMKDLVIEDKSEKPIKLVSGKKIFIHFDNDVRDTNIVWYSRAKKRLIEYDGKRYAYYCPTTVWIYKGGRSVSVHVVHDKKSNSDLYRLSAPNIYGNGDICWGNVKFPKFTISDDLFQIEDLFWNSRFSNHMDQANFSCPVDEFYSKDFINQRKSHVKSKMKLSDLL